MNSAEEPGFYDWVHKWNPYNLDKEHLMHGHWYHFLKEIIYIFNLGYGRIYKHNLLIQVIEMRFFTIILRVVRIFRRNSQKVWWKIKRIIKNLSGRRWNKYIWSNIKKSNNWSWRVRVDKRIPYFLSLCIYNFFKIYTIWLT